MYDYDTHTDNGVIHFDLKHYKIKNKIGAKWKESVLTYV